MRKNFSKLKKRILGIVVGVSVFAFSVSPVFAQDQESDKSTSVPETAQNVSIQPEVDATVESIQPRAGEETWTGSGFGGSYRFTDYNLTPVKTMGQSGTLLISGSFYGDDGYANSSRIKLTAQIRSTSGVVRASTVVVDDRSGATYFAVSCNVSAGDRIQIYFDASSIANPPGIYRSAYVEYDYAII